MIIFMAWDVAFLGKMALMFIGIASVQVIPEEDFVLAILLV